MSHSGARRVHSLRAVVWEGAFARIGQAVRPFTGVIGRLRRHWSQFWCAIGWIQKSKSSQEGKQRTRHHRLPQPKPQPLKTQQDFSPLSLPLEPPPLVFLTRRWLATSGASTVQDPRTTPLDKIIFHHLEPLLCRGERKIRCNPTVKEGTVGGKGVASTRDMSYVTLSWRRPSQILPIIVWILQLSSLAVSLSIWRQARRCSRVVHLDALGGPVGDGANPLKTVELTRRQAWYQSVAVATAITALPSNAEDSLISNPSYVTVPLEFTGSELLIYYRVDGSLFRAALDTGSPFLMVPGSCGINTRSKAGCYREQGVPSGLSDTYEQFDGFQGNVEWRMATVSLVGANGSLMAKSLLITFGVASESIMGGPGGVFFGLIRDTDTWIRPSFLGQTPVESLQLDLRTSNKTLTLSQDPMISNMDRNPIRLTTDLRRKFGAPVAYYTARAQSITVNGYTLAEEGPGRKPIYVIFDTGVTGMIVSRDLFNERYVMARQRREKNLWGHVDIAFRSLNSQSVVISADKPLTTVFDPQQAWTKFRGRLIVMGLSFLDGNRITIDIDRKSLLIEAKDTIE